MKKYFNTLISFLFLFTLIACDKRPEIKFETLDGQTSKLSDYRGRWVLINYWASWCAPCWKEIPELNKLHLQSVIIFGVNVDQISTKKIHTLVKKMNIQFPVLTTDPSRALRTGMPTVLPSTILIGPDGQIKKILFGEQATENLIREIKNN